MPQPKTSFWRPGRRGPRKPHEFQELRWFWIVDKSPEEASRDPDLGGRRKGHLKIPVFRELQRGPRNCPDLYGGIATQSVIKAGRPCMRRCTRNCPPVGRLKCDRSPTGPLKRRVIQISPSGQDLRSESNPVTTRSIPSGAVPTGCSCSPRSAWCSASRSPPTWRRPTGCGHGHDGHHHPPRLRGGPPALGLEAGSSSSRWARSSTG